MTGIPSTGEKSNLEFGEYKKRFTIVQDEVKNICGLKLLPGDVIEMDHIVPKTSGGADHYGNLQALHGHCHDQKS